VRFTVLGSGTAKPDPDRGPAGFLVTVGPHRVLVDGGSGTLQRLARQGVDATTLDGGVYSHRHVDHTGDLVPLLFAMAVPPARPEPYPVWAGEGFADFLSGLEGVYGRWIRPPGGVSLTELPLDGPGRADLGGGLTLRTLPAAHSAGALHLSFEAEGRRVVFSGDTGPSEALARLAAGANLLVTECAGPDDDPIPGHLWPEAVAELVDAARPAAVWLTHFYGSADPAAAVATVGRTGVPVHRAADGDRWEGGPIPA
jgi:ribonuclease BN (tRNA processing enzyme)